MIRHHDPVIGHHDDRPSSALSRGTATTDDVERVRPQVRRAQQRIARQFQAGLARYLRQVAAPADPPGPATATGRRRRPRRADEQAVRARGRRVTALGGPR